MERSELKSILEALIFVSEEPLSLDLMAMMLEDSGIWKKDIEEALNEIKNDYSVAPDRGLQIIEVAGGYQFRTKPSLAGWIQKLNVPKQTRLTQAAMETLAIIAYRQPLLRSDIEAIRGVDSGGVLKTLLERELIRIIGKSDEVGRPLVYGTTKAFLEMFGLNSLKDLPTLKEIEELETSGRVGDLGKEPVGEDSGVGDVIDEFKEGLTAYVPDPEKLAEDSQNIQGLEDSIKRIRRLEKDIFPKPVEELQAVPKDPLAGEADGSSSSPPWGEGQGEGETEELSKDEGTTPQDTGPVD